MATTNEQVIESLNRLLAACTRSERGFRIAAETAKDSELKTIFKASAHQRGRLASELRMEIRQLRGEPERLEGVDRPEWLSALGAAASRQDEHGVVVECQGMNQAVVTAFESALQDRNLPFELLVTARRRCDQVVEAAERLTAWATTDTAGIGRFVLPPVVPPVPA